MRQIVFVTLISMFFLSSYSSNNAPKTNNRTHINELNSGFTKAESDTILAQISGEKPASDVFEKCLKGYVGMKEHLGTDWNTDLVTIIDFRLSSTEKRLWVIDLNQNKVIFHTLVAHGKNTGEEFAVNFSNKPSSHKSSLGFYLTGNTYQGKHGLSLYLDGMEKGINDNARKRAIVMHGADYVSPKFISRHGRLGRSFGCPSIQMDLHQELINTIKDKTCLFIYYSDSEYENSSKFLNPEIDQCAYF